MRTQPTRPEILRKRRERQSVPEVHLKERSCELCQGQHATLFQDCHAKDSWSFIREAGTVHVYQPRETIFHAGTPVAFIHLLCQGTVQLSIGNGTGQHQMIRVVSGTCEILDKAGLQEKTHSVSCVGLTACQISMYPREPFLNLVQREPGLVRHLLVQLSAEIGTLLKEIRQHCFLPVSGRLAQALLNLAQPDGGQHADGWWIPYPLTRQEIADLVGVSRETASRFLSAWHRNKLIKVNGQWISILKPDRLAVLAGCTLHAVGRERDDTSTLS